MKNINSPFSNTKLSLFLACKDYTVSRETFSLWKDEELEMLITLPKPSLENLPKYYESENYISHTDSKKTLIDKIYQIAKNYSIKKKVKLVKKQLTQNLKLKDQELKTILDIGCGTGDFLTACKNANFNVVGVEPNEKARNLAKTKLEEITSNIQNQTSKTKQTTNIQKSITSLNKKVKYNTITMWHVLEHVPNLTEYISQLKELLQEKGTLIIAVPNYNSFDANYYKEFWAAFDVPRHLWHFSQKSIKLLFEKENMEVVKTVPMKLDSFYVSLLSEKYKTGKSNFIKSFFIGIQSNFKAKRTKEYSSLIYILKNK